MRSFHAAEDYESFSSERESRAVNAKYYLWVTTTFEVAINDVIFQVEVDGHVDRIGEHGDLQINDDMKFNTIFAGLPQFANPVLLNEDQLREDEAILWSRLEESVDFAILKHASKSNDWETDDV